jgi:hypothetical protein
MMKGHFAKSGIFGLIVIFLFGCATSWTVDRDRTFYERINTRLNIVSDPRGEVTVNGDYVGVSPVSYPLTYKRGISQCERKASCWRTDPGKAFVISVLTLGGYLPFSFIPTSSEHDLTHEYIGNDAVIRVTAEGYMPNETKIDCQGEVTRSVRLHLEPMSVLQK